MACRSGFSSWGGHTATLNCLVRLCCWNKLSALTTACRWRFRGDVSKTVKSGLQTISRNARHSPDSERRHWPQGRLAAAGRGKVGAFGGIGRRVVPASGAHRRDERAPGYCSGRIGVDADDHAVAEGDLRCGDVGHLGAQSRRQEPKMALARSRLPAIHRDLTGRELVLDEDRQVDGDGRDTAHHNSRTRCCGGLRSPATEANNPRSARLSAMPKAPFSTLSHTAHDFGSPRGGEDQGLVDVHRRPPCRRRRYAVCASPALGGICHVSITKHSLDQFRIRLHRRRARSFHGSPPHRRSNNSSGSGRPNGRLGGIIAARFRNSGVKTIRLSVEQRHNAPAQAFARSS